MASPRTARPRNSLLALGALGVVFGDIGTSPLYAFSEIFTGAHELPVTDDRVLGALSLVFWTLTLIVAVKYVLIVMRADNQGEGGIMALASLATSVVTRHRAAATIMVFGVLGAALFYGDGIITPAVSVLSAVEGLEIAAPGLSPYVVPLALALLIGLFLGQRYGTGRVGALFGPVMLLWFVVIGVLGLASVIQTPAVLASVSPAYAVSFLASDPLIGFLALGSVVLCVTGAEALYADMGQFGRRPIRISWFLVAAPALYLNYLGQGALVLRYPGSASDSFYLLVPGALQLPMVLLATVATVIASQAVISGAFSMTAQAIQLGYLPRLTLRHTSASERGQVYVPLVNWMLMFAVIGLVIGFQDSSNLASAYGIAVTGTFVITTCLITVVARHRWNLSWWIVGPVAALFLVIDVSFFTANLTKFDHGGWFPIVAAAIIFSLLTVWRWGSQRLRRTIDEAALPMAELPALLRDPGLTVVAGTVVYLTPDDGVPAALVQRARLLRAVDEHVVILHQEVTDTPRVASDERVRVESSDDRCLVARVRFGFMEPADPTEAVRELSARWEPLDPDTCLYCFFSPIVEPARAPLPVFTAVEVYAFMQRNATDPQRYLGLPPHRVIEVRRLVEL